MTDVLSMCQQLPQLQVAKGEPLLREFASTPCLYVLKTGSFQVLRGGVPIVTISEPGAFMGEISAVLGSAPTATLIAAEDSTVHVIADAATAVLTDPELTFAIAQSLARRLNAVTAYLVDLRRQYGGSNTHLGLMDQVLGSLININPDSIELGSERSDVPDY